MIPAKEIRDNFSQVASCYERYADIQGKLAQELLKELVGQKRIYESILDIGCGSGWLLQQLKRYFQNSKIFGLDISFEMVKETKRKTLNAIVADALSLPFRDGSFNLVVSNAVYQWVPDLDTAFKEAARILHKEGYFVFNCFGAETLEELRNCFNIEENYLPEEKLIRECLEKAHFTNVDITKSVRKKYFDNLVDILSWLKYIGANRINAYQVLLTPKRLAEANYAYSCNYRSNGKVYASFEVIQVKAKK